MLFKNILLPGVIVPAVAAAVVYLVGTLLTRQERTSRGGAGLALAAAFLAAFVGLNGWPRLPPVGSTQRLFFLAVLAAAVAFVACWRRREGLHAIVRGVLVALVLGFVLQSKIDNAWSVREAALWLAGLFVAGFALSWALEKGWRHDGDEGHLLLAAVRLALLGGTAFMLGLSGSALLAQLAGALATAVFAVEVLARLRHRRPWLGGDAAVVSTVVFGLLLSGHFYAKLAVWPALLLTAAFLLLALGPQAFKGSGLIPLVPLAVALGLVVAAFLAKQDDPYADYYGSLSTDPAQTHERPFEALALAQVDGSLEEPHVLALGVDQHL